MKRTSSESNLFPYIYRENSNEVRVEESRKALEKQNLYEESANLSFHPACFPPELLFIIFSSKALRYKDHINVSLTCKNWNVYITSESFLKDICNNLGVKVNFEQTWRKTYRYLQEKNSYIFLDCSYSMKSISLESVEQVKKIAFEIFKNKPLKGIYVGFFATGYHIDHFSNYLSVANYLDDLDNNLKVINVDNSNTEFNELLKKGYQQIQKHIKQKYLNSFFHVVSDCDFDTPNNIINYIKHTPLIKNTALNIIFYNMSSNRGGTPFFITKLLEQKSEISLSNPGLKLIIRDPNS